MKVPSSVPSATVVPVALIAPPNVYYAAPPPANVFRPAPANVVPVKVPPTAPIASVASPSAPSAFPPPLT